MNNCVSDISGSLRRKRFPSVQTSHFFSHPRFSVHILDNMVKSDLWTTNERQFFPYAPYEWFIINTMAEVACTLRRTSVMLSKILNSAALLLEYSTCPSVLFTIVLRLILYSGIILTWNMQCKSALNTMDTMDTMALRRVKQSLHQGSQDTFEETAEFISAFLCELRFLWKNAPWRKRY